MKKDTPEKDTDEINNSSGKETSEKGRIGNI